MTETNNNIKENSKLSEMETALIMGTLLGDAHIQKRGESYRLKIAHGIKQHSYLMWKYSKLNRLCLTTQPPKIETDRKGYQTVVFYATSGKWLKEIFDLFYKKTELNSYRKTITPELIEALPKDPLLLAVFFMDDGSVRNDCYAGKLATQGFSKEENQLLASYFKKWDIECKVVVHNRSKNQYYLSIPATSFGTLVQEIRETVKEIPEMLYKLNDQNKPRNDLGKV